MFDANYPRLFVNETNISIDSYNINRRFRIINVQDRMVFGFVHITWQITVVDACQTTYIYWNSKENVLKTIFIRKFVINKY